MLWSELFILSWICQELGYTRELFCWWTHIGQSKRGECMSRPILVNLCGRKNQNSILNYVLHTYTGMVFYWNTSRKKFRLYSCVQISRELNSIFWRPFLWQSKRGSAKKMVGFHEVRKSIEWQKLIVLIKHSDTPPLYYSMVCPTAKKTKLEGLMRKGTENNLKVAKIDKS